jgi:metalloendopeptidase OMA1, mitochondrial
MRQKHLATIVCACLIVACQTVEQTGRSQFIIVSESQELQLGDQAYQETLKKNRLSTRSDWQAQLRRVGQRIAAATDKPDYKWGVNLIQGKEINAFALPGGKVVFWEGQWLWTTTASPWSWAMRSLTRWRAMAPNA